LHTALGLLFVPRMKTLTLFIALVLSLLLASAARAQDVEPPDGAVIRSAQVSGIDDDRLSPGLRQDIKALTGQPLSRERLRELAARIEGELPDYVAAVRSVAAPDSGAQVVFLVARLSDQSDVDSNINARYIVETVEITGISESRISQTLRDDVQALVGKTLDREEATKLAERLRQELPGYIVTRTISRGSRRGQIHVVFEVREGEELRWLHFQPSTWKFVFHSDQGWSYVIDAPIMSRDYRVMLNFAFDNGDDLVEEYSGIGGRFESRKVGTDRLGASLSTSWYDAEWRDVTLAYLRVRPDLARAYDDRANVTPLVTFALLRQLRVTGGFSITELDALPEFGEASLMANAFIAGVGYDQRWKGKDLTHTLEAGFTWHDATASLESDYPYKRYFGSGAYRMEWNKSAVLVSGMAGRITGQAPLFERFTIGDSSTLRGWDKWDIAPAGGDRMYHVSAEFRHHGLALFTDVGSLWDDFIAQQTRVAAGLGFHTKNVFATLGFPLNTDNLRAVFTAGVRF
jgi:hypothetical protein